MAQDRPDDEPEVLRAFYAEPEVAERLQMLNDVRARREDLIRVGATRAV